MAEPERFLLLGACSSTTRDGRYVPREILVPAEIPDRELLEAWLTRAARHRRCASACPQRGEKVRLLELVVRNARWPSTWSGSTRASSRRRSCAALRDLLDLEVEPRRIECFDISNIQGSDIVASMVVFEDGLPKKSDYRKFRDPRAWRALPDDFASMREVVGRRYRRLLEEGKELPDLVLIDGGKGQLGAAMAALEELGLGDQPVASLAKREEVIFLPGREEPVRAAARARPCCSSCSACATRRTASRSASTARRAPSARCARSWTTSPAWAPARRRKLLSRFGSLRGVRGASLAELAQSVGAATAARIRERLHKAADAAGAAARGDDR